MSNELTTVIDDVLNLKSYRPNKTVNSVMSRLVSAVIENNEFSINSLPGGKISRVRNLADITECYLETYWSKKIVRSWNFKKSLNKFPYRGNYKELVSRELSLLEGIGVDLLSKAKPRILIIGSGPLPLTALEISLQVPGAVIDQLDVNKKSAKLGAKFSNKAGISGDYSNVDGRAFNTNFKYDVILLAALAGSGVQDKQDIINSISKFAKKDGVLLLRGAIGARTLLYSPFNPDDFMGIELLKQYNPTDEIINSVYIYRVI